MKISFPMPGGGSGITLFSKLIRTKDLRSVQGDDPRSTKPKLTVCIRLDNAVVPCRTFNFWHLTLGITIQTRKMMKTDDFMSAFSLI